jgi:hypothetical protein
MSCPVPRVLSYILSAIEYPAIIRRRGQQVSLNNGGASARDVKKIGNAKQTQGGESTREFFFSIIDHRTRESIARSNMQVLLLKQSLGMEASSIESRHIIRCWT